MAKCKFRAFAIFLFSFFLETLRKVARISKIITALYIKWRRVIFTSHGRHVSIIDDRSKLKGGLASSDKVFIQSFMKNLSVGSEVVMESHMGGCSDMSP